jgi:hypothetical protein
VIEKYGGPGPDRTGDLLVTLFPPLGEESEDAVEGVLGDGRKASVCGSLVSRRGNGGTLPGVRYLL